MRDDSTLLYLARTLVDDLPEPCLPPGYQVRPVAGEWEAEARAAPAHAAFGSQTPFSYYWPRYRNFMRAPVYPSALDLAIEVPNGRLVAFCLCWLNTINQVGHVESVGVHPDFQRRGLGRAVVQAGLRLLQARGMNVATVCTVLDDPTANQLYKGVGFCPVDQLYTYTLSLI